jgi:hypothetical protein
MFSETRYALNGDLRVAYRASREGPRDIVFVPTWFTCCEHFPELPPIQGSSHDPQPGGNPLRIAPKRVVDKPVEQIRRQQRLTRLGLNRATHGV